MENSEISSRTFFSTLALMHAGMVVGLVLFLSIAFYINASGGYEGNIELIVFIWVIPLVAVSGMIASILVFRAKIQKARGIEDFVSRLSAYKTALIIRWALLEGPALLAVIGYLISGEILFFSIAVMLIMILLISRPSRKKLAMDLQLSSIEKILINDPAAMIS